MMKKTMTRIRTRSNLPLKISTQRNLYLVIHYTVHYLFYAYSLSSHLHKNLLLIYVVWGEKKTKKDVPLLHKKAD